MPPSLECLRHVLEKGSPSESNLLFGAIDKPLRLDAGGSWLGRQTLTAL